LNEVGVALPLLPSLLDHIPLTESALDFSVQTYLSTTENRASRLSKVYPTVQFYIVFSRYVESDGRVTGSSIHTHRVTEYFQVDSQGIIVYITKVFCEALVFRLGAAVIF
jgi:hypothetical protein